MIRRPPRATRTDNLFPSTSRFRSPVTVQDLLPAGMRLRAETVRIDGVRVDALVRANGREFAVTLPGIAGARSLLLTYLAEVIVSAQPGNALNRSEEHPSELQSPMRISYAVFCMKKKKK